MAAGAETVLAAVKEIIPKACVTRSTEKELQLTIPVSTANKQLFIQLFNMLEMRKHDLHVTGYDVRDSGLEQVFVKVTAGNNPGT